MSSPHDWQSGGQNEGHEAHRHWPPPDYTPQPAYPAVGQPSTPGSGLPGYPPAYPTYGGPDPYGAADPYGTGPLPGERRSPQAPGTIKASMWLWLGACLIYLTGWVLAVVFNYPYLQEEVRADPSIDPEDVAPVTTVVLVVGVVAAFLAAVPYLVFTFLMRAGRSWARVLMTILGGVGLITLLLDVLAGFAWRTDVPEADSTEHAILIAMAVGPAVLTIAAIVTMFLPRANQYFRDAGEYRRRR